LYDLFYASYHAVLEMTDDMRIYDSVRHAPSISCEVMTSAPTVDRSSRITASRRRDRESRSKLTQTTLVNRPACAAVTIVARPSRPPTEVDGPISLYSLTCQPRAFANFRNWCNWSWIPPAADERA